LPATLYGTVFARARFVNTEEINLDTKPNALFQLVNSIRTRATTLFAQKKFPVFVGQGTASNTLGMLPKFLQPER
jgi:hypothetical protein